MSDQAAGGARETGERDGVSVEIIVPVYNNPHHLRRCVQLLYRHTDAADFRLILVDDGSDAHTKRVLAAIAATHANSALLIGDRNEGFIRAVNRGLAASRADYLVLLNIDVLVTPGWLHRLLAAAQSDPSIGLVCPVSNNAENLSIAMPRGYSFVDVAALIAARSRRRYPDAATVVDYCMLLTRDVLEAVGPYDPIYAPVFVEEADYQYRAAAAGFRAVVADDCYVFHFGGQSRLAWSPLRTRNLAIFRHRWGARFDADLARWAAEDALGYLREARTRAIPGPPIPEYDIVFSLPMAAPGVGGMITVVEIVNRLILGGYRATVTHAGPWRIALEPLFTPLEYDSEADFLVFPPRTRVLVATAYQTVDAVATVCARYGCEPAYFVQDYEGYFDDAAPLSAVAETYDRIGERIVVSGWLQGLLREQHDRDSTVIPVGVSTDEFYPRSVVVSAIEAAACGRTRVFVLLRDDDRRGAPYILEVARLLARECPELLFVCAGFLTPPPGPNILSVGLLDRQEMSRHLTACDIALDASVYQGFGLLGIEAMACGLATVLSDSGGCREYAEPGGNCLLVAPRDVRGMADALKRLQADPELRARLGAAGRETALRFDWDALVARHADFYGPLIARARPDERRYAEVAPYRPGVRVEEAPTTLYRCFDGFDHLYTADPTEALRAGYTVEGPAFAVYPGPLPGLAPLHRLAHPRTGDHLYAVDLAAGVAAGYRDEGRIGFIAQSAGPGLLPLYRGYHRRTRDHLYSLDPEECDRAGYRQEGIVGWVPPIRDTLAQPSSLGGGREGRAAGRSGRVRRRVSRVLRYARAALPVVE